MVCPRLAWLGQPLEGAEAHEVQCNWSPHHKLGVGPRKSTNSTWKSTQTTCQNQIQIQNSCSWKGGGGGAGRGRNLEVLLQLPGRLLDPAGLQVTSSPTARLGQAFSPFLCHFWHPTRFSLFSPSWYHVQTKGKYLNMTLNNYKVLPPNDRVDISKSRRGGSARQLNVETCSGGWGETTEYPRLRTQHRSRPCRCPGARACSHSPVRMRK